MAPSTLKMSGENGERRKTSAAAAGICSAEVLTRVTGKKRVATEDVGATAAKRTDAQNRRNKVARTNAPPEAAAPICSALKAKLGEDDPWAFIFGHEGMGRSDRNDWKEHAVTIEAAAPDDPEESEAELGASWRKGLAELRKSRPILGGPMPERSKTEDATAILKSVRRAVRKDSWEDVVHPRVLLSVKDVNEAAKHLEAHECEAVVQACALRYTLHPLERRLCGLWIQQLLEVRGSELVGERRVQAALRPLRAFLAKGYGGAASMDRSSEALACLGKWRLALALRSDGPILGDGGGGSGDEGDDKE